MRQFGGARPRDSECAVAAPRKLSEWRAEIELGLAPHGMAPQIRFGQNVMTKRADRAACQIDMASGDLVPSRAAPGCLLVQGDRGAAHGMGRDQYLVFGTHSITRAWQSIHGLRSPPVWKC